jgi:hypothetical protein
VRLPRAARPLTRDLLVAVVVALAGLLVAMDVGALVVLWWLAP